MKEKESIVEYSLAEIDHLKIHGRTTDCLAPLTLFWTGSGIEINVTGSELWIEAEAQYDLYEPWISILVNGAPVSRQMLTAGRHWICIFRGMNGQTVKQIRLVKDVQAMPADPGCSLHIHAVKTDGAFRPVADKPYRIEFIGDSITSGEGAVGSKAEADWIPMWFSAWQNYTYMTAEALNADCRVISQSGWGVLTGWDNNPSTNIPDTYEQVCGVLAGATNAALGAFREYDFQAWQPHVVVVNLGTNDGGAFYSPEWQGGDGKTHKQRLNEDGTFHAEDLAAFEAAVVKFLVKLRKYNSQAHMVWAYGMLGLPMMPSIYRAVDTYTKQYGDKRVSVFQLPNMTEESAGARSHPGVIAHRQAADQLAGYLQEILAGITL